MTGISLLTHCTIIIIIICQPPSNFLLSNYLALFFYTTDLVNQSSGGNRDRRLLRLEGKCGHLGSGHQQSWWWHRRALNRRHSLHLFEPVMNFRILALCRQSLLSFELSICCSLTKHRALALGSSLDLFWIRLLFFFVNNFLIAES